MILKNNPNIKRIEAKKLGGRYVYYFVDKEGLESIKMFGSESEIRSKAKTLEYAKRHLAIFGKLYPYGLFPWYFDLTFVKK